MAFTLSVAVATDYGYFCNNMWASMSNIFLHLNAFYTYNVTVMEYITILDAYKIRAVCKFGIQRISHH